MSQAVSACGIGDEGTWVVVAFVTLRVSFRQFHGQGWTWTAATCAKIFFKKLSGYAPSNPLTLRRVSLPRLPGRCIQEYVSVFFYNVHLHVGHLDDYFPPHLSSFFDLFCVFLRSSMAHSFDCVQSRAQFALRVQRHFTARTYTL